MARSRTGESSSSVPLWLSETTTQSPGCTEVLKRVGEEGLEAANKSQGGIGELPTVGQLVGQFADKTELHEWLQLIADVAKMPSDERAKLLVTLRSALELEEPAS